MSNLLETALAYAELGWHVFPAPVGERKSHKCAERSDGRKWGATSDPDEIASDFARWPRANVGIMTGPESGLVVIDVDTLVGHANDGMAAMAALVMKHGPLPVTVEAATPSGGRHLYYRFPEGETIQSLAGHIAPGIDQRGNGGIVIAPPSRKPDGRAYTWTNPPWLFDVADCPEWLLERARKAGRPHNTPPPRTDRFSKWGEVAIDGVLADLRKAPEGQRNDALNTAAFRLGQVAGAGLIGEGDAIPHLRATAQAIGLNAGETDATIKSAWEAGLANPRGPEDRHTGGERIDPETGEITCAAATFQSAADPVDLWAGHSAPELPAGLLPAPIETFARSQGATMGVDPAGLAMACLAVCAAAITDAIELQVKQHDPTWRESARLWVALVGSPSMKKSPMISAAARPLRKIDAELMERYTKAQAAYGLLTAKEKKAADRPRQERRIISDSTIEAAQEVLKDSPRGVLSLQDELSGFFGSMDKYAPGKGAMADRGFWLQAYNGGSYSLNRIGRGAALIPNCSISLVGGIQPEPIRAIAGDTHDDGLIQRLIPIVLRPSSVGRDAPNDGTTAAYERLIDALNSLQAGDAPLRFDADARAVRERLEREHLELVQSLESVSPKMAAHLGKHDGLFARLCVLWHCIERQQGGRVPDIITGETAERVAQFMVRFIRRNAVAFYAGLLGMSHGHDRLVQLAAWIVAEKLDRVTARDVQRSGQAFRHVSADEVRALCEKLEAFGWGTWGEPGEKSNRRPFVINPRVHDLFARHGQAEAERRAKARKLILETVGG